MNGRNFVNEEILNKLPFLIQQLCPTWSHDASNYDFVNKPFITKQLAFYKKIQVLENNDLSNMRLRVG